MNATGKNAFALMLALAVALIGIVLVIVSAIGLFSSKENNAGQSSAPSSGSSRSVEATPDIATTQPEDMASPAAPAQPVEPVESSSADPAAPADGEATPAPPAPLPGIPAQEPNGTRPAPAGVDFRDRYAFFSPSRNIYCEMDGNAANCGILQRNYTPPMPCENGYHMVKITAVGGEMTEDCIIGNPGAEVAVMDYGRSVNTGNLTCLSQEAGVVCWNNLTGAGFLMNRDGITKF
ncbi:MAG: hypothetical protein Q3999_00155 [Buchananella hordeovulneris]|nr:hypothetical protein [Buchananella hordeovulneris]